MDGGEIGLIVDGRAGDVGDLRSLLQTGGEALLIFSVPGCSPCGIMKGLIDRAVALGAMPPARHEVVFVGGSHRDERVTDLLGRPLTMFPSVLLRSGDGDHHWLRGLGDKAGVWTSERIADWIRRSRRQIAGERP